MQPTPDCDACRKCRLTDRVRICLAVDCLRAAHALQEERQTIYELLYYASIARYTPRGAQQGSRHRVVEEDRAHLLHPLQLLGRHLGCHLLKTLLLLNTLLALLVRLLFAGRSKRAKISLTALGAARRELRDACQGEEGTTHRSASCSFSAFSSRSSCLVASAFLRCSTRMSQGVLTPAGRWVRLQGRVNTQPVSTQTRLKRAT